MGTGYAAQSATCSQAYLPLPDPSCTPGAYNPDVTQSTIDSTICVSGWTATVRPSTSYTNALKIKQIAQYGYSDTSTADYEEDHQVPLELGGAPKAAANLWPEPRYGTKTAGNKDAVENKLKKAVCNGTVTLSNVDEEIPRRAPVLPGCAQPHWHARHCAVVTMSVVDGPRAF
jgi:hypothetical protein